MEAATAPMITAGIVATEVGLDSEIVLMMNGLGIPLSFITLSLWALLLSYFY